MVSTETLLLLLTGSLGRVRTRYGRGFLLLGSQRDARLRDSPAKEDRIAIAEKILEHLKLCRWEFLKPSDDFRLEVHWRELDQLVS